MPENSTKSVEEVKAILDTTKNGKPCSTIDNAAIVFREDPVFSGNLKVNLFRDRVELTGTMPWNRTSVDVNEMDDINIRYYMERNYQMVNDKKIREGMRIVASENSYHPVRDYFNSLVWDGKERIRHALHHFLGAPVDEFTYEFMKLFLLGTISRVFLPGCKFDYMLCLVGGQGAGKSSFARFLACKEEWFCDDIKRLDDEKVYEHLAGHLILEIAEMLALNNTKCNEAAKAFLSRQNDNYRLPYGVWAEDRPRQCVFIGTSNIVHFLPNDRSGNRRYLPVMCNLDEAEVHILENEEESREYITQLWAEAMELYGSGKFEMKLPKAIERRLAEYQEPFMQEDTWADLIKSFLEDYTGDIVCTRMLYREALDMYGMPNKIETAQIMEIMSRLPGWKRFNNPRQFKSYKRQKGWERVTTISGNQPDNQGSKKDFIKIDPGENPFET